MTTAPIKLFVYGTLRPGRSNHQRIARHVLRSQPGSVRGVLLDLGAYPALVPGDGIVRGDLLLIDESGLLFCDAIEGYAPGRDRSRCLFVRTMTSVQLEDGDEDKAWVFEFADPERVADRPPLVVGDDDGVPVYAWSGS